MATAKKKQSRRLTNPKKRATKERDLVAQRRKVVWDLRISRGLSYRVIADKLGIGLKCVFDDLEVARAELRQDTREFASEERARDLADIEFFRLKLIEAAANPEESIARTVTAFSTLLARKARLLGLDAPVKAELSGPDGGPLVSAGEGWEDRLRELGWTPPAGKGPEVLPGLPFPGAQREADQATRVTTVEVTG